MKIRTEGEELEGGAWSAFLNCSTSKNLLVGYQMKVGDSKIGVTGIRFRCSDTNFIDAANDLNVGSYLGMTNCPAGTAICGINSLFLGNQGPELDDSALNDIKIHCCRICATFTSNYIEKSTKECLPCHYSCKTCFGELSTQCLSCFHTDVLANNTCIAPASIAKIYIRSFYFIFILNLLFG